MNSAIITAIVVAVCTLILQKSFTNIISGVNLLIMRPFKKGDKVSIRYNGNEIASGHVSRVGFMRTRIKAYDRDIYILANSVLDSCVIVNSDYKAGVNHIEKIRISLDSNISKVKAVILETLIKHDVATNTQSNTNITLKYEDGGITVKYNVRTETTDESYIVCSEVCEHLVSVFSNIPDVTLI